MKDNRSSPENYSLSATKQGGRAGMAPKRMDVTTESSVRTWLGHVKALADGIGPRGSATPGERRGSEYCAGVLRDLGYSPITEIFP